jgi:EpsI family protein
MTPPARRLPRLTLTLLAIVAVVAAGWPAMAGMVHMWSNSPMYSYGWLVPAISAFVLWSRREQLRGLSAQPAVGPGLAVLGLWAVLLVAGRLGGILLLEQIALVVAIVGLVLLFAGLAALRASWAAIAYLMLGVPIWDGFTEPLHLRFQLMSAGIGVSMLQALGIPAYGRGTFIDLPTLTIEVARACSGVNYLIAVLALGLPLAYLYLETWWRRVVLIVAALVIAASANSLRVAMIGALVYYDLGAPLHGPAHLLHGLFVSAIGHVALFVGLWLLGSRGATAASRSTAAAAGGSSTRPASPWSPALIAGTALVWLPVVWIQAAMPAPVHLVTALDRLPAALGPWQTDPYITPATPAWWPAADQQLNRRYRDGDATVDLHVGYFERQRQSHEVVTFLSADLHRGARRIELPGGGGDTLAVNVTASTTGPDPRLTVFWYEIDGSPETQPFAVKMRTLWHAVGRRRSNGAVVSLSRPWQANISEADQVRALLDLAPRVHAALGRCLPGRGAGEPRAARLATISSRAS